MTLSSVLGFLVGKPLLPSSTLYLPCIFPRFGELIGGAILPLIPLKILVISSAKKLPMAVCCLR